MRGFSGVPKTDDVSLYKRFAGTFGASVCIGCGAGQKNVAVLLQI